MICIVAFAAFSVLLNLFFLEKYYIYKNREFFEAASKQIVAAYSHNPAEILDFINQIDRMEGISCIIADRNLMIEFSSFPLKQDKNSNRLPSELEQLVRSTQKASGSSSSYSTIDTSDSKVREIVFVEAIGNGGYLILRKPVTWIIESAGIANNFLLYTGILIIGIGGIFIYILAMKMTRPIIQMSESAKSIAALDFDKRIEVVSHDEIGMLSQSINDISEKLSVSINALKQDVERRKFLIRNISHDLKTPISVIKGYTEGLQYGLTDNKDQFNRYCNVIKAECDRMDGMIQDLLELSKLESGSFKMAVSSFNVRNLLDTIVERFMPVLNQAGISISLACDPVLEITADRELLDRLLSNYLSNALYHAEGQKRIRIEAEALDGKIKFTVVNTGHPISAENLEKIWDVFYKADRSRSRLYSGHGLGLSIVKAISELHGGICGCENLADGVEFYVEIPRTN